MILTINFNGYGFEVIDMWEETSLKIVCGGLFAQFLWLLSF